MKRTSVYPAALALALALGACSRESGPRDSAIEGAGADTTGQQGLNNAAGADQAGQGQYASPAPDPVINVPNPGGGGTAVGSLQQVNNSGVTGNVTVAAAGTGTLVSVSITGAPAGGAYSLALHQGKCGENDRPVAPLSPIRVDANGIGAVTDTAGIPVATVLDGNHAVVVKLPNAGPATPPAACAPIPVGSPGQ